MVYFYRLIRALVIVLAVGPVASFAFTPAPVWIGWTGFHGTPDAVSRYDCKVDTDYNADGYSFDINTRQITCPKWINKPTLPKNMSWPQHYAGIEPASCPANSTGTTSCSCTAPYVEDSTHTSCVAPPPSPDEDACKKASDFQRASLGDKFGSTDVAGAVSSGSKVCIPTPGTSNSASVGCTMNFSRDITLTDASGNQSSQGWVDFPDGFATAPCSLDVANPTNDPLKPPPAKESLCPAGQQMGQINGVDSCQAYGTGTTTTTNKNESTEKNDSTGKTTEQKDSVTVCVNGKCTTTLTTTTTNTPAGSSTSTSTSSSTTNVQGKDEYCKANPTSKECDSTGAGGTADGKCRPGDKSVGCSELGDIPKPEVIPNSDKAVAFTKDSGWGAATGTCPAPRVLNLHFGTVQMPWTLICDFATGIRPLILAFAYLSAALIFFGMSRKH